LGKANEDNLGSGRLDCCEVNQKSDNASK
jgi:hypothetical protein